MKFKIFKIRDGKFKQWKDWCDYLLAHKSEVLDTLKEEKVTREVCVLYGDKVLYVMEGEGLPATDREINRLHVKNRQECLEVVEGETLFDFKL